MAVGLVVLAWNLLLGCELWTIGLRTATTVLAVSMVTLVGMQGVARLLADQIRQNRHRDESDEP